MIEADVYVRRNPLASKEMPLPSLNDLALSTLAYLDKLEKEDSKREKESKLKPILS
ncbi:MAG: hypothetical protein WCK90_00635 [archaeon]